MASLEEERKRGEQARRIVEDPIWIDAWAQTESALTAAWKSSPVGDAAGREELYRLLIAARKVQKNIENTMLTGKMAKIQLEQREQRQKRERKS